MRPSVEDKRVTRVSHGQVALLQEALRGNRDEAEPSAPESKLTPAPLQPKRPSVDIHSAPSRPGLHENISRSSPYLPILQEHGKLESDNSLDIRYESPWELFEKGYECDLAGTVAVCIPFRGERNVRAIRRFSIKEADNILQIARLTNHKNVVSVLAGFRTADALYTLSEFDPITLDHIVACKQYPKPSQLASLMSQLLDGIAYLVAEGFRHTSLDCSSVLMSLGGELKIARLECCVTRQTNKVQRADFAPISKIMMELMQKYLKPGGAVGIDNPERWKICPAAIEFLSATTSANSFQELKEHRFLTENRSCPEDLVCLVWFALISARTFYSWQPWSKEHLPSE